MNGIVVGVAAASFIGDPRPVMAFFRYDARSPLEIRMTLRDEISQETGPTFHFSREMLDEAVGGPIDVVHGIGDVRIMRFHHTSSKVPAAWEFLQFDLGEKTLVVEFSPVRDFIIRSFVVVPFDDETTDGEIDDAIAKILEAAS